MNRHHDDPAQPVDQAAMGDELKCSECGHRPSEPSGVGGKYGPFCGMSPAGARQPMWACRFGAPLMEEYHAGHDHDDNEVCLGQGEQ